MDDTSKYLIHARITADGVVERSDVVGAVFGQTEGLLGDELDLRDLQQSSKVGRIDVEIESENGQSFGKITIASSLDRVETAILAASLETISRVGPCQSRVEVTDIEDVRQAKRRAVVERAKELLAESFDDAVMDSTAILEEVRESVRVEDVTEYGGLPAGPHVAESDAIVVVEGRSDVLTLLRYGVKNAIAVEGTNVPEAVADLTRDRTVTAFLDGDRGGELILRELAQVGDVDFVAFAPEGRSVEDLSRREVLSALREKVPFTRVPDEGSAREVAGVDVDVGGDADAEAVGSGEAGEGREDGEDAVDAAGAPPAGGVNGATGATGVEGSTPDPSPSDGGPPVEPGTTAASSGLEAAVAAAEDAPGAAASPAENDPSTVDEGSPPEAAVDGTETGGGATADAGSDDGTPDEADGSAVPGTLPGHVREVAGSGRVRLLDDAFAVRTEADAVDAFDAVLDAEEPPYAVVLDGELEQRLLDVAAQRGVEHVVAGSLGEFVKRPVGVRVRTTDQVAS
jgi:hypothetical protein